MLFLRELFHKALSAVYTQYQTAIHTLIYDISKLPSSAGCRTITALDAAGILFPRRHLNNVFTVDFDGVSVNHGLSLSMDQHAPPPGFRPPALGDDLEAIGLLLHNDPFAEQPVVFGGRQ